MKLLRRLFSEDESRTEKLAKKKKKEVIESGLGTASALSLLAGSAVYDVRKAEREGLLHDAKHAKKIGDLEADSIKYDAAYNAIDDQRMSPYTGKTKEEVVEDLLKARKKYQDVLEEYSKKSDNFIKRANKIKPVRSAIKVAAPILVAGGGISYLAGKNEENKINAKKKKKK